MPTCCVPGCEHYQLSMAIGIPFHRFPRDPAIRKQWLIKVRNENLAVNASLDKLKNCRVCGKHFVPSDYERDLRHELTGSKPQNKLKENAVPSVFPFGALHKPAPGERSAFKKREELRQQAERKQPSFAFGSARQEEAEKHHTDPQPSTSTAGVVDEAEFSTDVEFSSPLKSLPSTPSKSSPFKPETSEEETTTTTTESETESQTQGCSDKAGKVVVVKSKLEELFKRCQVCGEGIIEKRCLDIGSKHTIIWECVMGHEGRWESCPDVRGMAAVDLQLASGIVLSGNTYQAVSSMTELVDIQLFSKSTFNRIQNTYILPVIDSTFNRMYFQNMAKLVLRSLDGEGVSLLGDGRSDSPGFSAKYTTYTVMEETTGQIVEMQLVQVTEAGSSVAMEKEGFIRCMENLLSHGVKVETVTTDRSPSIRKVMREKYGWTNHQFDCWHICKGVKKKCLASGRKKGHEIMLKWTKSITNHLWYCCSACGGDAKELKRLWHAILHHITGVHSWEDEDGVIQRCNHPPLTEEEQESRRWFDINSTVYRDLSSIVLDRRLNTDLEQLNLFKHTSGLEVYHATLLKFAPKRLHFHYSAMNGRMQLAVIDHNYNTGRQEKTQAGKPVYRYVSSKQQGGEWTAKKVFEAKSHGYAVDMMSDVIQRRQDPAILYDDKAYFVKHPNIPRNIAKERRPPVEELVARKIPKKK